jgi:hypothetical protein
VRIKARDEGAMWLIEKTRRETGMIYYVAYRSFGPDDIIVGSVEVAAGQCRCNRRHSHCYLDARIYLGRSTVTDCKPDHTALVLTPYLYPSTKIGQCSACKKFVKLRYLTLPVRCSHLSAAKGNFRAAEHALETLIWHLDKNADPRFCSTCNMGLHRAMKNYRQCEEAIERITQWHPT